MPSSSPAQRVTRLILSSFWAQSSFIRVCEDGILQPGKGLAHSRCLASSNCWPSAFASAAPVPAPESPSVPSPLLGIILALLTLNSELLTWEFIETKHRNVTWRHINIIRLEVGLCQHYLGQYHSPEALRADVSRGAAARLWRQGQGQVQDTWFLPSPRPAPDCSPCAQSTRGAQPCPWSLPAPLTDERGDPATWPEKSRELGGRPRPSPLLPAVLFLKK